MSGKQLEQNVKLLEGDTEFRKHNQLLSDIRLSQFGQVNDVVYLDHAGAGLYSQRQLEQTYRQLSSRLFGNPHSRNPSSKLTADLVQQARFRILQHFNTSSDNYHVIFTSGATAALKLVLESFVFKSACHNSITKENHYDQNEASQSITSSKKHSNPMSAVEGNHSSELEQACLGILCYLEDNHTSVIGMREVAKMRNIPYQSISKTSDIDSVHSCDKKTCSANHLFIYPGQSNFCGRKYPLSWIQTVQDQGVDGIRCKDNWFVVLDAAALVTTSQLDLNKYNPDFVTVSFYKMFGLPTGLGALLVKSSSSHLLEKHYFGGGTVQVALASEDFHAKREDIEEKFEDGTIAFLDIISLQYGFDALNDLGGGMSAISQHTFKLASYVFHILSTLQHRNGAPAAKLYHTGMFLSSEIQGPVVNFNLLHNDGSYIGYSEVEKLAELYKIHLRTGCFCNLGACQAYLKMSSSQVKKNFKSGHVCGDDMDLIDGFPTGSVRISFGYMSTWNDAQQFLAFVVECFLDIIDTKMIIEQFSLKNDTVSYSQDDTKMGSERLTPKNDKVSNSQISNAEIQRDTQELMNECNVQRVLKSSICSDRNSVHIGGEDNHLNNNNSYKSVGKNQPLIHQKSFPTLSRIFLYPVKSCCAFEVSTWPIGKHGLLHDREWMIVNDAGVSLNQKRAPQLCRIRPSIDLERNLLVLNCDGLDPFTLPIDNSNCLPEESISICQSKVCGDRLNRPTQMLLSAARSDVSEHYPPASDCDGIVRYTFVAAVHLASTLCHRNLRIHVRDCGAGAGDWVSEALSESGLHLVQLSGTRTARKAESGLSLANEAQYLLVTESSIGALNKHLQKNADDTPDFENLLARFRGNLIISGTSPFAEETWSEVTIGQLKFKSEGCCSRCQMICVDQTTGQRDRQILPGLLSFRNRKGKFGVLLQHIGSDEVSQISAGDVIHPKLSEES